MRRLPRYPIYVPSKGRAATPMTARFLARDGVPFHLVVEPAEVDEYRAAGFDSELLVLPESGQGLLFARLWIREHSLEHYDADRHWQFDDNIQGIRRLYDGERIPCDAGPAIRAVEDLTDRYSNVGLSGLAYQMFVVPQSPAFFVNVHVYSATLVNNRTGHKWRLLYNDDTDICLQVIRDGLCTLLVNVFMVDKARTMTVKGGNYDADGPIDYLGDGRLKMARALEEAWPGIVKVTERWGRPQHSIDWTQFDEPLRLRDDVDLDALPAVDEYGLDLVEKKPVRSKLLLDLLEDYRKETR